MKREDTVSAANTGTSPWGRPTFSTQVKRYIMPWGHVTFNNLINRWDRQSTVADGESGLQYNRGGINWWDCRIPTRISPWCGQLRTPVLIIRWYSCQTIMTSSSQTSYSAAPYPFNITSSNFPSPFSQPSLNSGFTQADPNSPDVFRQNIHLVQGQVERISSLVRDVLGGMCVSVLGLTHPTSWTVSF